MRLLSIFFTIFLLIAAIPEAQAQSGPAIIRDTEIEDTLKVWISPLLKAAELESEGVHIILIQNPDINAFVAGGPNIFIYSGLLEKSENPDEVIGVLAHELGHISGGHLIAMRDALENASYESFLGALLGIGAAIATGDGRAAAAISAGTQSMAQRRFLAHSRLNESSADQAALTFLEKAQVSPVGLVTFMEKLEDEELLPPTQQTEYIRTHPLTRNRLDTLRSGLARSDYKDVKTSARMQDQHDRMRAKLIAFINPEQVPWIYSDRDTSLPAVYARAIAAYRQNRIEEALRLIDDLLDREPDNPYFLELKGQMLKDFGRVQESVSWYEKAVRLHPNAPLIRIDLAHAMMESGNDPARLKKAIDHLNRSRRDEPHSSRIHRLLATAYGRLGQEPQAKLHLAEEALMQRKFAYARRMAEDAQKGLPENSRESLRARDIIHFANQQEENEDR